MMSAKTDVTMVLWIIVVCGIGTYLIRLLPMIWHARGSDKRAHGGVLRRALDAIGPSAIVALLTVSLWSLVDMQMPVGTGAPVVAGLLGVWVGHRYLRTIAWATLSGVLCYGAASWLISL